MERLFLISALMIARTYCTVIGFKDKPIEYPFECDNSHNCNAGESCAEINISVNKDNGKYTGECEQHNDES